MDIPPKPHKIYQMHRENQRERILEMAEMLFLRDGIDNVSIGDIAGAARISRVTLYEYFPNKEEVAWAVFQKVIEDLRDAEAADSPNPSGSGYQQLEWFVNLSIRSLKTQRDHVRFIALFNYLYAREGSGKRMREAIEQASAGSYGVPAEMIRAGIADGSIRPDLDPDLTAAMLYNLQAGMTHRFALLGTNIQDEYGYGVIDLYREVCRTFLRGVQAIPS